MIKKEIDLCRSKIIGSIIVSRPGSIDPDRLIVSIAHAQCFVTFCLRLNTHPQRLVKHCSSVKQLGSKDMKRRVTCGSKLFTAWSSSELLLDLRGRTIHIFNLGSTAGSLYPTGVMKIVWTSYEHFLHQSIIRYT